MTTENCQAIDNKDGNDVCPVCGNFRENCTCGTDYEDEATIHVKHQARMQGIYSSPDQNAPNGYLLGRPIIGRNTEINGGVFAYSKEAIVVDDRKYGLVRECWEELKCSLDEKICNGENHKKDIFRTVLWLVLQKMRYDREAVDQIDEMIRDSHTGWYKVTLDRFISKGVGVCRHQALLAGYLLEKMTKEGYISPGDGREHRYFRGRASVERSFNRQRRIGHAWAAYTTYRGEKVIIDPANKFVGTFDQAEEERLQRKNEGRLLWYYEGVSNDDPEDTEDMFANGEP